MLIGSLSGIPYLDFLARLGPVALVGLFVTEQRTYGRIRQRQPSIQPRFGLQSRNFHVGGPNVRTISSCKYEQALQVLYQWGNYRALLWLWFNPDFVPTRSGRYSDDLRRIDGRWVFTVRRISIALWVDHTPA